MSEVALKQSVGPPTKFNSETIDKALHYLNNYHEYGKNIPSVAKLAQVLDVTRETLYTWAKQEDKKELSDIIQKLSISQEVELLENGLSGAYNSTITKLVLGTHHGYHEKQEVTAQVQVDDVGNSELARRLAYVIAQGVTIEGEATDG